MNKKTITLLALLLTTAVSKAQVMLPYQNPNLSFHERAVDLVSRLSREEKCAQLGNNVNLEINRADYSNPTAKVVLPMYQYWNEALHGVARSGAATSFPESKGMSSSWDRQLIFDCADATSTEARVYNNQYSKGLNYWCPTINMSRDPRWGRDEENYGEDPYLAGQLAVQFIKGMQGDDEKYLKTVACAKHFAANNYEQGRQGSTSFMTEHNLREYYLPAFEAAVKEGKVKSIMSSYNALSTDLNEKNAAGIGWTSKKAWGGKPNAMNDWLLTNILRKEWGFDGYVTSDCAGVSCIYRKVKHFYYGDIYGTYTDDLGEINSLYQAHATADAIKAGNDINCEFMNKTAIFQTAAQQAIEDGFMSEADLDQALIRVLETRFALGEFDEGVPYKSIAADRLECDEHQALALKAARESIVLLKNTSPNPSEGGEPLLPLSTDKKVALIGPYANQIMLGDYSGTPTYTTTPFQAFAKKLGFTVNDGTVQFENYTSLLHSQRSEDKLKATAGCIGNTATGDIFAYENVDFGSGCSHFVMSCGAKTDNAVAKLKFYLDDQNSDPILTVTSLNTGNWTNFQEVTATVDPEVVKGKHTVIVKICDRVGGETFNKSFQEYCGNFDYFRFYNADNEPLENQGPLYMVQTSKAVNDIATDDMIARAVAVAQKADVVVFLGGTDYSKPDSHATGTESHDRWQLTMPGNQTDVLKAVQAVNPNVVLVLETNSSMDITWEKENLPAIVEAWYGGQAQGQAICDVIYGDYNPGGKLTSTWYNSLAELPAASDSKFGANGMLEYNIDDWGYTYMYYGKGTGANVARQAAKPMYPFGYGLSYTTFEYSALTPLNTALNANGEVTISFKIKNTGTRKGAEVAQLYIDFPNATIAHAKSLNRRLVGFERVELEAGEEQTVQITLRHDQLAVYDDATHTFRVEGGTANFHVSASSADDRLNGTINAEAATVKDTYLSDPAILTAVQQVSPTRQPVATGHIYNLQGSQVADDAHIDSLPQGVYVVNGAKYVKR